MAIDFKLINKILFTKPKKGLKKEDEPNVNSYIIQRWASMYSPALCKVLNETSNTFYNAFDNNSMWYKYFMVLIPKLRYRRVNYIKKAEKPKDYNDISDVVEVLASKYEMSEREVENYINEYDIDVEQVRKGMGNDE